jgi:O-antigen/teichoic acid export membrane protein
MASQSATAPSDTGRVTSRGSWSSTPLAGGGALVGAKIVFVLTGYAIYAGLSRLLTPEEFGTYLVVNSTVAVLNAVFVTGTIQAVSRFVSQQTGTAGGTLRAALRLQLAVAGSITAVYFAAAPLLARIFNDPGLTIYLRVSAAIPLAYAFYAAIIGYLNGRRQFPYQAGFDVAFSFLKVALVIALPALGYGAFGAVVGFAVAAVTIFVLSWVTVGINAVRSPGTGASSSELFRFEATVMGHVALTNLLMQVDLLMVKALSPIDGASAAAGMYGAAAKLAQIPHSVLVALNFLIFPYIARSTAASAPSDTAYYIRQALRVGTALVVGPAVILASVSVQSVHFVFGTAYTSAAQVLAILAWGYVAFSLFTMTATIINSVGRPAISLAVAAATLAVQVALASTWIPSHGIMGAALASSIAYGTGLAGATIYLVVQFGFIVPWATVVRALVAVGLVAALAQTMIGSFPLPIAGTVLGLLYLGTLVALREWTVGDVRGVLGRTPQTES